MTLIVFTLMNLMNHESTNLVNKRIVSMIQDHLGIIWIGTDGFGLYKFDITKNKLTHYK